MRVFLYSLLPFCIFSNFLKRKYIYDVIKRAHDAYVHVSLKSTTPWREKTHSVSGRATRSPGCARGRSAGSITPPAAGGAARTRAREEPAVLSGKQVAVTSLITVYFGSAFATPFFTVRHQLLKTEGRFSSFAEQTGKAGF